MLTRVCMVSAQEMPPRVCDALDGQVNPWYQGEVHGMCPEVRKGVRGRPGSTQAEQGRRGEEGRQGVGRRAVEGMGEKVGAGGKECHAQKPTR